MNDVESRVSAGIVLGRVQAAQFALSITTIDTPDEAEILRRVTRDLGELETWIVKRLSGVT